MSLLTELAILILAAFVGFQVISKVPTTLPTPLLSGPHSIHWIVLPGRLIPIGPATALLPRGTLPLAPPAGAVGRGVWPGQHVRAFAWPGK
mgnify:CR=1 FL=1